MAKQWGAWKNLSSLGEGGAGYVFKVKNSETGQLGALKRLKNLKRRERFKSEVDVVNELNHPNIVKLLDSSFEEDQCYAVFEFESGGSLADLSKEELLSIPMSQRLQWCEQICSALHAAHEVKKYHRDVKPENILISEDRKQVKLCDFGLVYVEDNERQTATMEQVGSRYYIPPELEDGRADQVSEKSDIYSMGKVLYYVLTGTMFARERHRESNYNLASNFENPYLEAISRILDRSITDNIASRLESAKTMEEEIKEARVKIEKRIPIEGCAETYRCLFCGVGQYEEMCISRSNKSHNLGYYNEGNVGDQQMVFLECKNCGNCQRFKLKYNGEKWFPRSLQEWQKS